MTLRERLDQKQRRRLVVPIQITDPTADQHVWMGVMAALDLQRSKDEPDPALVAQLEKQLEEAEERTQDHFVEIELQSLPPVEWEAGQIAFRDDDGNVDWGEALAPLLEVSCVEEELRDAAYWQELMGRDTWAEGDTHALRMALLQLNIYAPDARVPKD